MNSFSSPSLMQLSPSRNRMYVIVVAERTNDVWHAWFRNAPEQTCSGQNDILAVLGLLEAHGNLDMDPWDMTPLPARSNLDRHEFLLPITLRTND